MNRFAYPLATCLLASVFPPLAHCSDPEWASPLEPAAFNVWEPFSSGLETSEGVAVYQGRLYSAAPPQTMAGVTVNYLARWSGSAWEALPGGGANNRVTSLHATSTELFAAGQFTSIGGASVATRFARWNGTTWRDFQGVVRFDEAGDARVIFNDRMTVSANNADPTDPVRGHVWQWTGSQWSPLNGGGMDDSPFVLSTIDGALYGVGSRPFPNQQQTVIWKWDGSTWLIVAPAHNDTDALVGYKGKIIAGGSFTSVNGVSAAAIAAWNGQTWERLGTGLARSGGGTPYVSRMTVYNGELWVQGLFTSAGGVPIVNGFAKWNGTAWSQAGPHNAGTSISGFGEFDGALVVSGSFTSMGGVPANGIARWKSDRIFANGYD